MKNKKFSPVSPASFFPSFAPFAMKIRFTPRAALAVFLAFTVATRTPAQDPCAGVVRTALRVQFKSHQGESTQVGFAPFQTPTPAPAKPVKYRTHELAGTMDGGKFTFSPCDASTASVNVFETFADATGTMSVTPVSATDTDVTFRIDFASSDPATRGVLAFWYGSEEYYTSGVTRTLPIGWSTECFMQIYRFWNGGWVGMMPSATLQVQRIDSFQDTWAARDTYDASTGLLTSSNTSTRKIGLGFPLTTGTLDPNGPKVTDYNALDYTFTESPTKRTYKGKENCRDVSPGWFKSAGEVTETLSDEDKESDVLSRAKAAAAAAAEGTSSTAYETTLQTDGKVSVSSVNYSAEIPITCQGDYDFYFTYLIAPRNGSKPPYRETIVTRRHIDAGAHAISGSIEVKDKDTNYTLENIEFSAPCNINPPAHAEIHVSSIHVGLSLGRTSSGFSAGEVRLDAEAITAALYAPSALTPAVASGLGVQAIRDGNNALRQIDAPQTFVDIATLDASSYEVRFYAPSDVGIQDPSTLIYALNGTPYAVFKFENPDAAQGLTERLRVTETRGGNTRVSEYSYDVTNSTWILIRGNGLRSETLVTSVSGADTTKTTTIRDENNVVTSKTRKVYHTFGWGEELVQEVLDPDGAALATNYEFYSDSASDGPNFGHLKQRTGADGSWEHRTYDAAARVLKTVRPFVDASSTAAENLCRVVENTYTSLADLDGDGLPEQLTTTTEKVLGQETSRQFVLEWSKGVTLGVDLCERRLNIQAVSPAAAWDTAGNLVTETLTYTADPFAGRTRRVIKSDGTAILSTYVVDGSGQETDVIKTGQPNAALDDIIDGRRTTTFISAAGQVTSETVTDIASELELSSWTATEFDAVNRPTRADYTDGTYSTRTYACCGLASERDRTGAVASYTYDALGRQITATRFGITLRTSYDPDGRIKTVTRVGTDASEIVQETNAYDLAGRRISRKDALNRETTYTDVYDSGTGHRAHTTTNPDGGTSVEVFARDGFRLEVSGTAVAPHSFSYGVDGDGLFTKDIAVGADAGGQPTATEWTKTYSDFAGRSSKTVYADGAAAQLFYNAVGQLVRQVDPDGVTTLFGYNARGEQEVTAIDLDANGTIDYAGTDRVAKTSASFATKTEGATYTVQRTTTQVWETNNADTPVTTAISEQSPDGLRSWQSVRGLTTVTVTTFDGTGGRTTITTGPDGVKTVQVFDGDRLVSNTVKTAADVPLAGTTYAYDTHHRLLSTTDARNGTTTLAYYDDDQIHTVTTPDPDTTRSGPGYDPQVTSYVYDPAGRVQTVTLPDGGEVNSTYWPTGALKRSWGARVYPAEYAYDPQGRMKTLMTWQNFAGDSGRAVTTWNYDPQRGFLLNKHYTDGTGPTYTYKPSGRLLTRTWARTPAVTTTYSYNAAGELAGTDYSDATPDVVVTYDRTGRASTITDASGQRSFVYHSSGQIESETYASGPLNGLAVIRSFDALNRQEGISVPGVSSIAYGYDAASRLQTVTNGPDTATYAYATNSPLVESLVFTRAGAARLTTAKIYDNLNRLTSISNTPSSAPVSRHAYTYNAANQRARAVREDNSYWSYSYDPLGQVTAAGKFLADDTPTPGFSFAYNYDDIGNRKTATANSQTSNYTANLLNQYTQRTVPGAIDVVGAASPTSTVTIAVDDGVPQPTARQGEIFHKQISLDNSVGAKYPTLTITGVKNLAGPDGEDAVEVSTKAPHLARNPELFVHDADGNLVDDARWHYTWDGENRLIEVETSPLAAAVGVPKQKLEFAYDAQGRRFQKKMSYWNSSTSAYALNTTKRFVYDGWNLLADLNGQAANAVLCTYTWGLDLSGSFQGAGGVGGLLFSTLAGDPASYAYAYDGNGNVSSLTEMETGAQAARYDYNAFGETVLIEGFTSAANPFRFSTKYTDEETEHLYYGHRFFGPAGGYWLSRDPIEEIGSLNIYLFVLNDSVNAFDRLGESVLVGYRAPNPATVVPTINPTGISGTAFRSGGVRCSCSVGADGKMNIGCTVSFTARIQLSRSEAATLNVTLSGIYGHEQRHILSRTERVYQRVVLPLANEAGDGLDCATCPRKAKELEAKYEPILGRNLDQSVIPDHSNDPLPNSHTPANGTPYPPQPGSPPVI